MDFEPTKRVRIDRVPFNYTWPGQRVSVVRECGPVELPLPMAQAAIDQGYGEPFDPSEYLVEHEKRPLEEMDGEDDLQEDEDEGLDEEE